MDKEEIEKILQKENQQIKNINKLVEEAISGVTDKIENYNGYKGDNEYK